MLYGIDVSVVQGAIDWAKVADSNVRFVYVKGSEGISYVDPNCERNLEGARNAGLSTGVYHFANMTQPAEKQVERLWNTFGAVMPDMPPVLDWETLPANITPFYAVKWAEQFCKICEEYFGKFPMIYTMPSFAASVYSEVRVSASISTTALWVAHYKVNGPWTPADGDHPSVPFPWKNWAMWQYSGDHGIPVPGIALPCDRNVFHGDEDAFRKFRGLPNELSSGNLPEDVLSS